MKFSHTDKKIALFLVLGLVLAGGLVVGGRKLGKKQAQPAPPESFPSPTITLAPTFMPIITPTTRVEVTPPPDETADWRTHTNTKYGYSIKYPPALEISSTTDNLGYQTVYLSFPDVKTSLITIGWHEKSKNENLYDWANSYLKIYDKYRFSSPRDITIDGHSAISIDSTINQSYTYFIFILKDDSNLIDLSLTNVPVGNTSLKPTFDQILSTFKFLE